MQWQSKTKLYFTLTFFIMSLCAFRTPAKLYAGAYSIKIQLKKDFTEYDIPVWIKPDQAESTIDAALLLEMGYVDKDLSFEEVKTSGVKLDVKKFKNLKSEWAFVPDFAKSCCHGVIGRDVLQNYEIRFDPNPPAHLEWKRLISESVKPAYGQAFLNSLKKLFSLEQTIEVPFVLNLAESKLELEGKEASSQPSLFSYFFVPPERILKVTGIAPKVSSQAKKAGFTPGLLITSIDGEEVSGMDRWLIEKHLRGEKGSTLKMIAKNKKEFIFDFSTLQFK